MSNYYEMYKNMSNPLTDDALRRIIDNFSKDKSTYDFLTRAYYDRNNPDRRLVNVAQMDRLYSNLFNNWKRSVIRKPREDVEKLISLGKAKDDYYKLQEKLKTIGDIRTKKEYDLISQDDLIEKYGWDMDPLGSWIHIDSRYIFQQREYSRYHVNHRLYLNIEGRGLHEISNQFIKKCLEKKIPFYFKISYAPTRDDTMVIYSEETLLEKYIDILKEIVNERPHLKQYIGQPPILTGKIDSWIGYGSEPQEEHSSYNSKRAKVIDYAIKENLKRWIKENKDDKRISYKKKVFTFEEFLAYNMTKQFVEQRLSTLRNSGNGYRERCRSEYGLTEEALLNPDFKAHIYHELLKHMPDRLNAYLNDNPNTESFKITLVNGKNPYSISSSLFYDQIKGFAGIAVNTDNNFIPRVRRTINSVSSSYLIDIDKFCFDVGPRNSLLNEDKKSMNMGNEAEAWKAKRR